MLDKLSLRTDKKSGKYDVKVVAKYLIEHGADMYGRRPSAYRLQNLLYAAQAEYLRYTGHPLFDEPIIAESWGICITSIHKEFKIHGREPIILNSWAHENFLKECKKYQPISMEDARIINLIINASVYWATAELSSQIIKQDPYNNAYKKGKKYGDKTPIISVDSLLEWYGRKENKPTDIPGKYWVFDIANYMVEYCHYSNIPLNKIRLQTLLYFVQAYFLIASNGEVAAFDDELYTYGGDSYYEGYPVVLGLCDENCWGYNMFSNLELSGISSKSVFSDEDRVLIEDVINHFKTRSDTSLINELIHHQHPWTSVYKKDYVERISKKSLANFFLKKNQNLKAIQDEVKSGENQQNCHTAQQKHNKKEEKVVKQNHTNNDSYEYQISKEIEKSS